MTQQLLQLRLGDSFEVLRGMEDQSIGAVVCDPPYGLEFMGTEWDRLEIPQAWLMSGGFSKPGIGDRKTDWPSFSSNAQFGTANPTCAVCGGRLRGAKKCTCEKPHDHWKPLGKPRVATGGASFTSGGSDRFQNTNLPSFNGSPNPICENCGGTQRGNDREGFTRCQCEDPSFPNVRLQQAESMQIWHTAWLIEVFRVLKPGGVIKAFSATRTFHRLAAAMESVGFENLMLTAWCYGSGFPKSLNVAKAIDRHLGASDQREVIGYQQGVGGENLNDIVNEADEIRTTDDPGGKGVGAYGTGAKQVAVTIPVTKAATPEAKQFEGWGTALKPAWEPFVVGRKPE